MNDKKALDIEEMKKIQLQILEFVHHFCEQANIEYFLSYGTLIGAIRHEGYIPWDDDIDLCMTRPNYDRFINEFSDKNNKYECLSYEHNPNFLYTFAKVMDKNTLLIENVILKCDMGINIDIFPIDGINDDYALIKKQIFLKIQSELKTKRRYRNRALYINVLIAASRLFLHAISHRRIIAQMIKNAKTHEYSVAQNVCCVANGSREDKPFPKKYLESFCLWKFEGKEYYVPVEYDSYLRSIYGDYMTLPPEEERTHHSFTAYSK